MSLPPEFKESIRRDIILLFEILKKNGKSYVLDTHEELARDIYNYYKSHSKNTVGEAIIVINQELRNTMITLNRLGGFKSELDRKHGWVRFYSWNPEDDINESIIDSCSVRLYLNPT